VHAVIPGRQDQRKSLSELTCARNAIHSLQVETAQVSLDRPILELELGKRATSSLEKAEIVNVGQALEMLTEGEASILAVDGFGRKSLADLKKRLRQFGYEIPEAAEEIVV